MADDEADDTAWRAVARRIEQGIASGEYPVGSKIPSRRDLVRATGHADGTITRALRWLAQEGVLESHRGVGWFPTGEATGSLPKRVDRLTTEQAQLRADVDEIRRHLGLEPGA